MFNILYVLWLGWLTGGAYSERCFEAWRDNGPSDEG